MSEVSFASPRFIEPPRNERKEYVARPTRPSDELESGNPSTGFEAIDARLFRRVHCKIWSADPYPYEGEPE